MSQLLILLLIVIAMGVVLYPVMQLMPSGRQRQQQKLREVALKAGIQIKIRQPELPEALIATYKGIHDTVAYSLGYFEDHCIDGTFTALRSQLSDNQWIWLNDRFPGGDLLTRIQPLLADLPAFIRAIELAPHQVSIFWNECGEARDIEVIREQLENLHQLLQDQQALEKK